MGILDDLLGNTAADASKAAAADTYGKQLAATQGAVTGLQQAGGNYRNLMTGLAGNYSPWTATGSGANDAVARLIADPSSVQNLPAYQFELGQGTRALDHSAVANGNLFSGRQGKALQAYGQNLADKTYGDQLSRLLGVSQQGLNATQGYNNTVGQGLQGELRANTSAYNTAYNGGMAGAGTIGQGDIAAAGAHTQGIQNLLNTGVSLAGMAMGAPPGMGSIGKLFGGGGTVGNGGIVLGGAGGPGQFANSAYR